MSIDHEATKALARQVQNALHQGVTVLSPIGLLPVERVYELCNVALDLAAQLEEAKDYIGAVDEENNNLRKQLEKYKDGARCPNCDTLRLQLGEARKDAERIDWIQNHRPFLHHSFGDHGHLFSVSVEPDPQDHEDSDFRRAIDAAMRADRLDEGKEKEHD